MKKEVLNLAVQSFLVSLWLFLTFGIVGVSDVFRFEGLRNVSERFDRDYDVMIIVGEGGTSGGMFIKAAETYQRENGGKIYHVKSGDEFMAAIRDFSGRFGQIDHLEYFGHGNNVGLYVNQAPNVNGGLYANDPVLNGEFLAASIYEVGSKVFEEGSTVKFNGCNVAEGYPEKRTLAQDFANYFGARVWAPRGPTEFSKTPGVVDPIPGSNFLSADFDGEVYMVPTYEEKPFVVVEPMVRSDLFVDVFEGQVFAEAVDVLFKAGLNLDYGPKLNQFKPYNVITYAEAREFCRVVFGERCSLDGHKEDERIRNLAALKMLIDAKGIQLKSSNPWYNSYVYWGSQNGVLTEDFVNKRWYTRGEMAELSYQFWMLSGGTSSTSP